MADTRMDTQTLLDGLNDIRLPSEAAGGALAEFLVALGLGLSLAWGISLVFSKTRSTGQDRPLTLEAQIDLLRHLPDAERSIALLHLARREGIAVPEIGDIYSARGPRLTPQDIEDALQSGHTAHA